MNEIITAGAAGEIVAGARIDGELMDKWLSYIDASQKTQETYCRACRQFILYLQQRGISRPVREDVIAFRDDMAKEHKATTVNAYLMAVKQLFKWAVQEGIYTTDITEHIKPLKIAKGHKKGYLTSSQAASVLENIDRGSLKGLRDYAIVALCLTTGLRTYEVCNANMEDLETLGDFTALYLLGKGRADKTEYVKVPEKVEQAIRAYLKARGKAGADEPLFASISHRNSGGRMTTKSVSRLIKEALVNAGLDSDRLTAHSLRHTAGTLALMNGASIQETQQLLRHMNVATTYIYVHSIEREKNNSEEKVAAAIFG